MSYSCYLFLGLILRHLFIDFTTNIQLINILFRITSYLNTLRVIIIIKKWCKLCWTTKISNITTTVYSIIPKFPCVNERSRFAHVLHLIVSFSFSLITMNRICIIQKNVGSVSSMITFILGLNMIWVLQIYSFVLLVLVIFYFVFSSCKCNTY